MRVLGKRVLLTKPADESAEVKTDGGLYLPNRVPSHPICEVVSMGEDALNKAYFGVGDKVMVNRFTAEDIKIDDTVYWIVAVDAVIAVL